jgi:phosphonate degradation associated HDIG domain protein
MGPVDEIFELFERHGQEAYLGEAVSQQEHALQAAHLAEQEGAPDALIVAALLHDVGHLLHGLPEDVAMRGIDGRHEAVGEAWLARRFGPEVTEPVRLHVAAKRYLCAVDPTYRRRLSPASVQSLTLQGAPMSDAEVHAFEEHPYPRAAVRLRGWDDEAKVPGLEVPGLEHYRARLDTLEEIRERAEELYRREIRPKVMPQHKGKFLVVDVVSGDYEIDEDDLSASEILQARRPDGVLFGMRIGYKSAYTLNGTMEEEDAIGFNIGSPVTVQSPE